VLARHQQLFVSVLFVIDGLLVAAAWLGAYAVRFYGLGLSAPLGVPPLSLYLWFGAVLTPVTLIVLRSYQLYRSSRTAPLAQELFTLAQGVVVTTVLAGVASFFIGGALSRSVLALFAVVATVLLCGSRVAIRVVLRSLRRAGRNLRHVLVVGTGDLARLVVEKIEAHPDYGIAVRGLVSSTPMAVGARVEGHPVLG